MNERCFAMLFTGRIVLSRRRCTAVTASATAAIATGPPCSRVVWARPIPQPLCMLARIRGYTRVPLSAGAAGYGSTGAGHAATPKGNDRGRGEGAPEPKPESPLPTAPKDKYDIADAYRWLYGALSRQPASQGLPATGLALVAITGEGILATQPAVLLGEIVDSIGPAGGSVGAGAEAAWPLFALIALSLVGKEVCTISRKYIVERQSTALQKDAFLEQSRHLLSVRVDALQDRRVGDLAVRLDKSVEGLIKLVKVTFMEGLPNVVTALVALSLAYHAHWSVGLAMVGAVAAGGAVTAVQVRTERSGSRCLVHLLRDSAPG